MDNSGPPASGPESLSFLLPDAEMTYLDPWRAWLGKPAREGRRVKWRELHRWDVSAGEARGIQSGLRRRVSRQWPGGEVRRVLAADVSFPGGGKLARGAVVVVDYPDLTPLAGRVWEGPVAFPYVPGLLAFREVPPLLGALAGIEGKVDLVLCDGQGLAHPRGMGLATHLGLWLGLPTIGCAKSRLCGVHEEPGGERGASTALRDKAGRTIGCVLRTRAGVRPVFVSVGHRIDLRRAAKLVLACSPRFRIPEPLRLAHRLAGGEEITRGY